VSSVKDEQLTPTEDPFRTVLIRVWNSTRFAQHRIAAAAGVCQQTASKWLSGAVPLPAHRIVPIEQELATHALTQELCRLRGGRFVPLEAELVDETRELTEHQLAAATVEASVQVLQEVVGALAGDDAIDAAEMRRLDAALDLAGARITAMRAELARRWGPTAKEARR
jgi:hypothetical protein